MRERIWRDDVSLYVCFCLKWPLAHLLLSSLSRAACLHPSAAVETSDCTSRPLLPGEVVIAWLNLRSALIGREIGTHVSVGSNATEMSCTRDVSFPPESVRLADVPDWQLRWRRALGEGHLAAAPY